MSAKVGHSTPTLHVADIARSIAFYERLGFVTVDTDRAEPLGWARLHCEGGALMFLRAEHAVDPAAQGIMLYMYTPDLPGLRAQLREGGMAVPEISRPPYMRSGEINLSDPDGYRIGIGHWTEVEHQAWLERIQAH